jgi:hypothetical protein
MGGGSSENQVLVQRATNKQHEPLRSMPPSMGEAEGIQANPCRCFALNPS